jgi:N-acetylmuramoyl-L-alanine amidase
VTREAIRNAMTDRQALVATLLGECANEPVEGQIGVACVIRNRAHNPRWWGRDIRDVCLKVNREARTGRQTWMFSCWGEDNANTERVYALAEEYVSGRQPPGDLIRQLEWIAEGVIGGALQDNTRSADHYLTVTLYSSTGAPAWSRTGAAVRRLGRHQFLRLEL